MISNQKFLTKFDETNSVLSLALDQPEPAVRLVSARKLWKKQISTSKSRRLSLTEFVNKLVKEFVKNSGESLQTGPPNFREKLYYQN